MLAIYIVNRGKDRIPRGKSSFKSCGNDFSLSSFHLNLAYQKFNAIEFSASATTDWKQWPVVNVNTKQKYQNYSIQSPPDKVLWGTLLQFPKF